MQTPHHLLEATLQAANVDHLKNGGGRLSVDDDQVEGDRLWVAGRDPTSSPPSPAEDMRRPVVCTEEQLPASPQI
ncbi:unnamed protein product [Arctogadus glacialis]